MKKAISKRDLGWLLLLLMLSAVLARPLFKPSPGSFDSKRLSVDGVKLGMTPQEVTALLGPPKRDGDNAYTGTFWWYADTSVVFDTIDGVERVSMVFGDSLLQDGAMLASSDTAHGAAHAALETLGSPNIKDFFGASPGSWDETFDGELRYSKQLLIKVVNGQVNYFVLHHEFREKDAH